MKHVTLAYAVAVLALAGSAAAQETPQTGAPVEWAGSMLDPQVFTFVQAERLEGRTSGGEKGYLLDLQGWVGTNTSKFWGKAEAEGVIGEQVEGVEVQALYSRMISPFFDLHSLGCARTSRPTCPGPTSSSGCKGSHRTGSRWRRPPSSATQAT